MHCYDVWKQGSYGAPALQAENRQQQFKDSPVGRAAYTAVKKAQQQDSRENRKEEQMAKDWLT